VQEVYWQHYRALLDKIAALGAKQHAAYGEQIRCRVGCFSCCRPPDTLFAIEAQIVADAVRALSPATKEGIRQRLADYEAGERELCPLLEDGRCQIYEARPVICRTHGYAMRLRDDEGDFLSWCELNFDAIAPDPAMAFDVEHLNTVLSVITRLGWPPEEARQALTEILHDALSSSSSP
jgi:Fe-S-cluster containining protein